MADQPVDNLPQLSATCIVISKRLILQQTLDTLGLAIHDTKTYMMGTHDILSSVCIDVPPHRHNPFLEAKVFYGEYCDTTDKAIESTSSSALLYLQKENIVYIDDANLEELTKCQRKLVEATSWAEAFEQRAVALKAQLLAVTKEDKLITKKDTFLDSTRDTLNKNSIVPQNLTGKLLGSTPPSVAEDPFSRNIKNHPSTPRARRTLFLAEPGNGAI